MSGKFQSRESPLSQWMSWECGHSSQKSGFCGSLIKVMYGTIVAVVFVSTHVRFMVRSSNILFVSFKSRRIVSVQCCSFSFSTKVSIIARRLSNASVPSAVILSSPWRDVCIDAEQTSSILNRQRLLAGSNHKGWAVKRARASKKVWCSGLGLCLETPVFDFGQGLRCRHCRCHWIMAAWFVFLHFFLVPLCWYAVSERQMLLSCLREV